MLISEQKLTENIAEYVLYMYQIEDVIRGFKFDLDAIIDRFVVPQLPDASFLPQYKKWYATLINQMQSQKIEEKGHLFVIQEVMIELSFLHNALLNGGKDVRYVELYDRAVPHINSFMEKSNLKDKNQIEVAFHALYMKLLLKLQNKEISAETEESFDSIRMLIAYLSRAFSQMKKGELFL